MFYPNYITTLSESDLFSKSIHPSISSTKVNGDVGCKITTTSNNKFLFLKYLRACLT